MCIWVQAFRHVAERMGVPRTIVTKNPMGRPMGAPADVERHTAVLEAAFRLLETAAAGGAIMDLEMRFRPGSGT